MRIAHGQIVGRIKIDPALHRAIHRHPGVRSISANQTRLPWRWLGQDIATHIACRKTTSTQTSNHEMGKVLTHSTALGQDCLDRRRNAGRTRIKHKLLMNAPVQIQRHLQHAAPSAKTRLRIVTHGRHHPHMRRVIQKFRSAQ